MPARASRRRRRGTGKRIARVAKNVMMNLAESKVRDRSLIPLPGLLAQYYHDNAYICTLHNAQSTVEHLLPPMIAQGDENYQRNGREIYSTGFRVKGLFDIPFDRRNTKIKIYLTETNSASGALPTDLFHTGDGTTGNIMLDRINRERFPNTKLLRTLRVKSRDLYIERGELTDAGSNATVYYDFWIPWRRKLNYNVSGGFSPISGCKEQLGLTYVFYDAAQTLTTDAVATRCEQLVSFYYKDP